MVTDDPGFTMELSQQMNYDQVSRAVAHRLDTDPYLLKFFKVPTQVGPYWLCMGVRKVMIGFPLIM